MRVWGFLGLGADQVVFRFGVQGQYAMEEWTIKEKLCCSKVRVDGE